MKRYLVYIFFLFVILISCNKEKESSLKEGSFEKSKKIIEDKKNQGDTLAMTYEKLLKFLPAEINGYFEKDKGTGKTINENGISWSIAEKKYFDGDQNFKISLADYNGAYGLYAGATAIFSLGNIENAEESSHAVILKNGKFKGWESYKKESKEAYLITGISDRFLLTLEAENQISTEFIKNIIEKMDFDKLINK
jgi:hypothetical protein